MPARAAALDDKGRIELFARMAEEVQTTVARVAGDAELPAEIAGRVLGWAGKGRGRFRSLPLASGWTLVRDMPAPQGRTFHSLWAERQRANRAGTTRR